jgi:hypothetical protein
VAQRSLDHVHALAPQAIGEGVTQPVRVDALLDARLLREPVPTVA